MTPKCGEKAKKVEMSFSSHASRSGSEVSRSSRRNCYCGIVAPVRTSGTEANMGRRFIGCGRYGRFGDASSCGFFRWIDPPMCECGKEIVPKLLEKIERLETEVRKCSARKRIYKKAFVGTWIVIGCLILYLVSLGSD